ncbi:MAG: OmpA family protein [Pseudomonadota bacterium]
MSPRCIAFAAIALVVSLTACQQAPEQPAATQEPEPASTDVPEPVSILRPDVEAETQVTVSQPAESYTAIITFPEGGSDIDADALAVLEQVKAADQFGQNGAIVLRTHSDSAGSDEANERASQARGLAVAEWLIAAGADPRRIDVIVFGEQNPIEPNALPDGSSNEEGRARNRRVEIEILASADVETEIAPSEAGDKP